MSTRLNEDTVKTTAAPQKGALTLWDDKIKGFGLRIFAPTARNPAGARSFFINYTIDGAEKRFTIGAFPTWTAKAARAEAKELRQRIDRGEDPAEEKRDRREAPTVKDLADRYKKEHLPRKSGSSQKNDWSMIQREILPRLDSRKVADVHQGDMQDLHDAITDRDAPVRANRVLAVASKMFSLSRVPMKGETKPWRDQAQGNPCKGIERNPEEGKERFFSEAELAAAGDALLSHGATPAADAIRLIMLTGCRPCEAKQAKWSEFDETGYWGKPSAHTKQKKRHRVPLSPGAIELIAQIRAQRAKSPRTAKSDYVFPGQTHGEPLKQLRSTWEEVSSAATVALWRDSSDPRIAGIVSSLDASQNRAPTLAEYRAFAAAADVTLPAGLTDARIYDFRHSFASIGVGGGLSLPIIGKLLGHTNPRTTQRYAHLGDDPLRAATDKIGAVIERARRSTGGTNVAVLRK
jgi:integrase